MRPSPLDLVQQLQAVHPGHVDVGQDQDQFGTNPVSELLQRAFARFCEMQRIIPVARLTTEALTKQLHDVRLIIDDQNADGHAVAPATIRGFPERVAKRGSRITNSVNSSGRLSTAIVPPCCCTTMS